MLIATPIPQVSIANPLLRSSVKMTDKMQFKDEPQTPTSDIANGSIIGRDVDWTPEEEAAVRRKFDFTITPLVTLLYMLCAIDR